MTPDELDDALAYAGRNKAPGVLFDLFCSRQIDEHALRHVLPGVWSGAEWPEYSLSRSIWLWWFGLADYPKPATPLTLYRGARPRYVRGMAWTRDPDKAAWFADHWTTVTEHAAYVYVATAPPEAVLADIDALEDDGGRGEGEIVVNPSQLTGVHRFC